MFNSKAYLKDLENQIKFIDLDNLKDKSILVTGACGLICSYLIDLMIYMNLNYNTNIKIYALDRSADRMKERFNYYYDNDLFVTIVEDVCSFKGIDEKIDYIIHGASPAAPKLYIEQPVDTMNSNYVGMLNLLAFAKENKSRVIYISSSDIYGETDKENLTEADYGYINILNARSSYSSSKRAAETLCYAYNSQYGVSVSIVRPAHIYGPTFTRSDSRAISDFLRNVTEKNDIIMKSDGSSVRSYCYVGDTCTGIFKVLKDGISGEAYNISNSNSFISIKDVAQKIADYSKQKLIISLPENQIDKKIDSNVKLIKMSSSKLENLGWSNKTDIDDGIKKCIEILKETNK